MRQIVVLGSLNMDLICVAPRIPKPGETILGSSFVTKEGGKGANQATAIARMGMPTRLIGCVGTDLFGDSLLASLQKSGVNTDSIERVNGVATGTAHITVDANGENNIVVIPGANAHTSVELVRRCLCDIASCAAAVAQLEVPIDAVGDFFRAARAHSVFTVLNPAPLPREGLGDELLSLLDLITPNENEMEQLTGVAVSDAETFAQAARLLHGRGVKTIICTMGAKGAFYSDGQQVIAQRAYEVRVVDTTCAGDAFTGAFVVRWAEGATAFDALSFAAKVAALTVTKLGAQESLPTRAQAEAAFSQNN